MFLRSLIFLTWLSINFWPPKPEKSKNNGNTRHAVSDTIPVVLSMACLKDTPSITHVMTAHHPSQLLQLVLLWTRGMFYRL
jgi:hypothetical protein